jgi:uncharacterized protein YecE (DUF72 family)
VYVGTSSWKYEGWLGQIYSAERYVWRGKFARRRFESGCLAEYAETFPAVCVDAGFYRFPSAAFAQSLAQAVPVRFRFGFKVTEDITVRRFPNLPRHAGRAGALNPHFLDEKLFRRSFLDPLTPVKEKVGVLILEFSRFRAGDFERGRDFLDLLDRFLDRVPGEWRYAVELRNPELFRDEYLEVLRRHQVAHVVSSWTRMPPPEEQMARGGADVAPWFVGRFLLTPGRAYAGAVEAFAPYQETRAPDPQARTALCALLRRKPGEPSFLFVNNRLEGSALGTLQACLLDVHRSGSLSEEAVEPPVRPGI